MDSRIFQYSSANKLNAMKKKMDFDRTKLKLKKLCERTHDLDTRIILPLRKTPVVDEKILEVAKRCVSAKARDSSIIFMMGAHVIRSGVQNYIIDLIKRGYISCLSSNGASIIHDFELALIGATTESVREYIKDGRFGLWSETGTINDLINQAYKNDPASGLGETIGKAVSMGDLQYKETSLFAAAYLLHVPATVHVGIGYDIIHEHPNCDGAATGALSYNDFLKLTAVVQNLEGGVVMNFGSAVMAPEVFLKALSMARNVAIQDGKRINNFSTLVCDLHEIKEKHYCEPGKDDPSYYYRPLKTMLVRTVADGGESFYVQGRHADTIPQLWSAIVDLEEK